MNKIVLKGKKELKKYWETLWDEFDKLKVCSKSYYDKLHEIHKLECVITETFFKDKKNHDMKEYAKWKSLWLAKESLDIKSDNFLYIQNEIRKLNIDIAIRYFY